MLIIILTSTQTNPATTPQAQARRKRLPDLIILVRHGESEGNADYTLYRTKPDNLVELTAEGIEQGRKAGGRIESIFQQYEKSHKTSLSRVHICLSPYKRTLQTGMEIQKALEHRIVRKDIQPRIREQVFGNLQGEDMNDFRQEQKRTGCFWYRFPQGESGTNVDDRATSLWNDHVSTVNERYGFHRVDALIVVTHGLTMRFVLMQLFHWSPITFHSVWNANNCDCYVLQKDLKKNGLSPYILDNIYMATCPFSSIAGANFRFRTHDTALVSSRSTIK